MTALSQICEVPCYQSYCVLNCERGFAEVFCGMTALSQICEVPCYQSYCVLNCERGLPRFLWDDSIVADL